VSWRYRKGVVIEREVVHQLKELGYLALRVAASKGPFDVIAVNKKEIKLVQVRTGKPPTRAEMAVLRDIPAPSCVVKEVWVRNRGRKGDFRRILLFRDKGGAL